MLEIYLPDALEWEHDPDSNTITLEDWKESGEWLEILGADDLPF